MIAGWVIDSSIGISWVHKGQASVEADDLLKTAASGSLVVIPPLWFWEMGNILMTLQRRGKISAAERRAATARIVMLPLTVDEVSMSEALHKASDLAETHALTVYDAAYLELALRWKLGLATRDNPLKAAAKACGVTTL